MSSILWNIENPSGRGRVKVPGPTNDQEAKAFRDLMSRASRKFYRLAGS